MYFLFYLESDTGWTIDIGLIPYDCTAIAHHYCPSLISSVIAFGLAHLIRPCRW